MTTLYTNIVIILLDAQTMLHLFEFQDTFDYLTISIPAASLVKVL